MVILKMFNPNGTINKMYWQRRLMLAELLAGIPMTQRGNPPAGAGGTLKALYGVNK